MEWKIRLEGDKKWNKYSYPYPIDINQRIRDWLMDNPEYFIKAIKSDMYKVLNIEIEDNSGEITKYEVDIALVFNIRSKKDE